MADIRSITILPAQPVQGIQTSQVPQGAGGSHADNITSLPVGTILSGFVVNRDASGNPVLRTPTGDITFATNFFLKIGSEVTIRIENNTAGTLAHILTVDGQLPEVAENLSAYAQEPDIIVNSNTTQPQAAAAPVLSPQAPATPGTTVNGTLVALPQAGAAQPAAQPPLPTGTQLTLKITSFSSTATASLSPAAPSNTQSSITGTTAYARAAGVPVTMTPPLTSSPLPQEPANNPATIAPPASLPPAPPPATPAAPAPVATGQTVAATVISNEPGGEANVQTPFGIVRLQPGPMLPAGSTITFEVVDTTPPPAQTAASATTVNAMPAPLTELAQRWTSLQQIIGLLSSRQNTSDPDFVPPHMPWIPAANAATPLPAAAPQTMSAGLMLFLTALRGGDFTNWLGRENVQWLQDQGHDALLKKVEGEFTGLARQFSETLPQHWQALFFPVAVGGELQQARLFVKRDRKQSGNQQTKKGDDTRFVVEVDLTQLGEMQMDGFVRKRDSDIQFDLVIRSLIPLPQDIQQDILQIYNDTGELTGYKGSLVFQTVREFAVNPMEEVAAHAMKTVVA